MNNQNGELVESAIEELCSRGCDEVNATIKKLEQDQLVSEVTQLNAEDRTRVLNELKSIMSVYDTKTTHLAT